MTACNDVQSASFGKKVVGTALAGTLAVGMVPAAALAAPADEAAANDGISALAMTPVQDFNGGKITGVTVDGKAVADAANVSLKVADLVETGSSTGVYTSPIAVTQVTTEMGTVLPVKTGDVAVKILKSDGSTQPADMKWDDAETTFPSNEAGVYYAQVTVSDSLDADNPLAAYANGVVYLTITVTGDALTGVTVYEGTDTKDTTFTYDGTALTFNYQLNGKTLVKDTDYTVAYYGSNGKEVAAPTAAGTYTAELTGKGNYSNSTARLAIVINKLDLSTANIVIPAQSGTDEFVVKSINGSTNAASLVEWSIVNGIDNKQPGQYTLLVTPKDADDASITGSQQVKVDRVAYTTVTWQYDGADVAPATEGVNYNVNLSTPKATPAFDLAKLTVTPTADADSELAYNVTVTDADGKVYPTSALSTPGTWTVTASVNAEANKYQYGGTETIVVKVIAGEIESSDVIVMQDGKVTNAPSFDYDGANVLPKIDITVKCGDKTLVEGTDYTLTAVNKTTKEKVEEAVNAGEYTVTVNAPAYGFASGAATFDVTVSALDVKALRVAGLTKNAEGQTPAEFLPYTGKEIVPVIEYTTEEAPAAGSEDTRTWTTLPAELYSIAYELDGKSVSAMQNEGEYSATVTMNNTPEGKNYTLASGDLTINVAQGKKTFEDVPSTAWFYDVVNQADANGYMTGYAGTKLFGPNDKITRGQVACVLFNMAGGQAGGDADDSFTDNAGFKTGFSDVDDHAYYAQAIAWAKQAGVVNGYAGTDKFGPNDNVTREQFAAMLANYAKATNKFVAVEDVAAVLDARPDGATVSDWAEESVAWAVSNKYMGNAADGVINPLGNITRAEVAAMAVNFQPTKLA